MPRYSIPLRISLPAGGPDRWSGLMDVEVDVAGILSHASGVAPPGADLSIRPDGGAVVAARAIPAAAPAPASLLLDCREAGGEIATRLVVQAPDASDRPVAVEAIKRELDEIQVMSAGKPIVRYRFNTSDPDLPRPYFHPIMGPTGDVMTQDGEVPGTREKHFHHTGLVVAHQNFTGGNNWQIGLPECSRMRHAGLRLLSSGDGRASWRETLQWLDRTGQEILFEEVRTVILVKGQEELRIDLTTSLTCGGRPVTWKPTPYHLLALRVPDALTVAAGGRIINSEGKLNAATAGASARWMDISGRLSRPCGVTIFDHPANPNHPTAWLNFENETLGAAPAYHEPMDWAPGQERSFRYRVVFHSGSSPEQAEMGWRMFARPPVAWVGPPVREA